MPPRDWRLRIRDILEAIALIEDYTRGLDLAAFRTDGKTVDAVLRRITIIGEAAGRVPAEVADAHPEVPWKVMRDFLLHCGLDRSSSGEQETGSDSSGEVKSRRANERSQASRVRLRTARRRGF